MWFRFFLIGLLGFVSIVLAHPIYSVDKKTKIVQKSDFVFEAQKKFPQVLTTGSAKSKDISCYVKIDLINGLVSTGLCDINKVEAYTRDVMWIGTLTYIGNGLSSVTSFDARTNYNNTYFGGVAVANPYNIWGINIDFDAPTEIADSSNVSNVTCPKGQNPKIVGSEDGLYYWDCYTPWKCAKDEYSVNEQTCLKLPQNASRNKQEGFACHKGFVAIADRCEAKISCETESDHYDEKTNSCWSLPLRAVWMDSVNTRNDFVCNSGFFKNSQYSTCDLQVTCEGNEHYDIRTNKCWSLPRNAVWKNHVLKPNDWTCLEGYVKIQGVDDDICVKKKKCNSRDLYQVETNSCWALPKNAKWNANVFSEDDWSCVLGYEKRENTCKKKVVCRNIEIQLENGKCKEIPQNSHKVDSRTWQCDAGYNKVLGNNKSYCEEKKSTSSAIPTEWIATGASILLGVVLLFVSIGAGK